VENDGKRIQLWKSFKKQKDAEAHLYSLSTDAREHQYQPPSKLTFKQYVTQWRGKYMIAPDLHLSTMRSYESMLDKHLVPRFEHRLVSSIRTADITAFRAALLVAGVSRMSVRNIFNLLNKICDDAVEEHVLRQSPMPRRKRQADKRAAKEPGKGIAITHAEARWMVEQCEADPATKRKADPELKLLMMEGLLAGLRRGEILALKWPDIEWARDKIHVRKTLYWRWGQEIPEGEPVWATFDPKTANSKRSVDLSPRHKAELRERCKTANDKRGFILHDGKGQPIEPDNFYDRRFKPALERARKKLEQEKERVIDPMLRESMEQSMEKFAKLTIHTLRHSFGSWKIDQGEDIVYVSRQLGHADVSITAKVYAHLIKDTRPEATAKTDANLFQIPAEEMTAASAMVH
jgi:integrase